jgi:TonB family protein
MLNSMSKRVSLLLLVSFLVPAQVGLAKSHIFNQPFQKHSKQKKKARGKGWFCAAAYEIRIVSSDGEIVDQQTRGVVVGKAIRKVEPGYPTEAVVERVEGAVIVEALVSETGDIISIKSVSGPISLKQASADAAKKWRFTPTAIEGSPVQALARITFKYDLGLGENTKERGSNSNRSHK